MALYSIHLPPGGDTAALEGTVFVKDGFTWGGFIFGPFWLLANRLWLHAVAIAVLTLVLGSVAGEERVGGLAGVALALLPALLVGFEGNGWKRWRLARRGYREAGMVVGRGDADMERRVFETLSAAPRVSARPIPPGRKEPEPGVLGLFPEASRP